MAADKDTVAAVLAIPEHSSLKMVCGKRFLTLKATDIEHYTGVVPIESRLYPEAFSGLMVWNVSSIYIVDWKILGKGQFSVLR